MRLTDLGALAELARPRGVTTVVDNTFATPVNQRPLAFGIDVVVHSATKYLGGHHDVTAGCVVSTQRVRRARVALLARRGRLPQSLRRLAAAARPAHARPARRAPQPQRARARTVPRTPPARGARAPPRPRIAPAARAGAAADERLHRHARRRAARRLRGGRALRQGAPARDLRRQPRRLRDARRPPRGDVGPPALARAARGDGRLATASSASPSASKTSRT